MPDHPAESLVRVYDVLASVPNLAADEAFVTALPRLDPALRRLAIERLFQRRHVAGLASLVGGFKGYDHDLRALIIERSDQLVEAVRVAMASASTETRLGAIELVQSSNSYHLAYLLSEVLPRPCNVTKRAAAGALHALAHNLIEPSNAGSDKRNRQSMADALHRALNCWTSHYKTEVLVAAMWLCDVTEPCLFEKASDIRTHISRGLNEMLRGESHAEMAPYALRALTHPDLRAVAARTISRSTDARFMRRLLEETWITIDPRTAKACARLTTLDWFAQLANNDWASLDDEQSRSAVRLIAVSGIRPEEKIKLFRRVILNGSPVQREAAFWCITEIDTPAATKLLRSVAAWELGDLSRAAGHELFRRTADSDAPLDQADVLPLDARPDTEVLTGNTLLDAYWDRFDMLDEQRAGDEGRRLRSRYPRFEPWLRGKLAAVDSDDRLRALRVLQCLGSSLARFEERVYAACHDSDHRVRSHAVALLAEIDGAAVVRILRQALNDPDHRVQANAIEVLDRVAASPDIAAKLESDNSRVRANAISSLLPKQHRDAAVALIDMLKDSSASRRLSALWVVERLRLTSLSQRVAWLAGHDPEDGVRERAREVVDALNSHTPFEQSGDPARSPR